MTAAMREKNVPTRSPVVVVVVVVLTSERTEGVTGPPPPPPPTTSPTPLPFLITVPVVVCDCRSAQVAIAAIYTNDSCHRGSSPNGVVEEDDERE